MEHFDIPQSFLKLPKVENIGFRPSQNYTFAVQGQIHSQQFLNLINEIIENEDNDWDEIISDTLQSHAIADELKLLSKSQIFDFIIHTLYANSQIDWNNISLFEDFLTKEMDHVSRWELPDLDFKDDIKAFNASLVPVELPDYVINDIMELYDEISKSTIGSQADRIIDINLLDIINNRDLINLNRFYSLISNIVVIQQTGIIRYENLSGLIKELTVIWDKIGKQSTFNEFGQKILFNIHSMQISLNDSPEALQKCEKLLNITISDISALPKSKQKSYLWLIDSIKAQVVNEVTKHKMELVTEDLLLRSIGDRFLNPENTDLKTWMYAIETSDLPIWSITLIIRGYIAVEAILHRYYSELPKSNNDNLGTINNFLLSLLKTFDNNYIISEEALKQRFSFHQEFSILDSWMKASFNQIKITPRHQYSEEPVIIERVEQSNFREYFEFQNIVSKILLHEYKFEEYLYEIQNERINDNFLHLIGNEKFASIFVDKFARLFGFAQNQQINGGSYPIDKYQQMVFFLHSWLPHLLKIKELVQDTIIIFLSFYNVVLNMVESYYSQKGRPQNAKLWDLNYKLFELNLFFSYGYPELNNITEMLSKENMFDNFQKMLGKFKVDHDISHYNTRYLALDSIYDVSNFKLNHNLPSIRPEKLHEDKIMEYLDLQHELQQYIEELRDSDLDTMKDKILNNPFSPRNPPLTLFDNLHIDKSSELCFPIIQPINAYAAAISFFDLDINFSPTEMLDETH